VCVDIRVLLGEEVLCPHTYMYYSLKFMYPHNYVMQYTSTICIQAQELNDIVIYRHRLLQRGQGHARVQFFWTGSYMYMYRIRYINATSIVIMLVAATKLLLIP
jgi:hypothetical protein